MNRVKSLLRSELPSLPRRNRSTIALIAFFLILLLNGQAVIGAGISVYAQNSQEKSALTLIELSGADQHARKDLSRANLDAIAKANGVTGVYPWFQRDLALSESSTWPDRSVNPGVLWASPVIPGLEPRMVEGASPGSLKRGQIILPEKVPGGKLRGLMGKRVTLESTRQTGRGTGEPARRTYTVVGISDNSVPGADGPTPAYVAYDDLLELNGGKEPVSFVTGYVKVKSEKMVNGVQSRLAGQGYAVKSLASQINELGGLFSVLRGAVRIFMAIIVVISLALGSVAGSLWVRHRYRDIGILKAVGWSRKMIFGALSIELLTAGLIAALWGIALGFGTSLLTTAAVSSADLVLLPVEPWKFPPMSSAAVILLAVPLCVVLGGMPRARQAARLDPDDVLRAVE